MKAMPTWLTHGFEVAGGILPAVGFGLLLRVMFKAQYIPYLIAGFLFVCYIQVSNLLPVAVLGAGFAVYEFFNAKSRQQAQPQPLPVKMKKRTTAMGSEISKKISPVWAFVRHCCKRALITKGCRRAVLPGRCCRS